MDELLGLTDEEFADRIQTLQDILDAEKPDAAEQSVIQAPSASIVALFQRNVRELLDFRGDVSPDNDALELAREVLTEGAVQSIAKQVGSLFALFDPWQSERSALLAAKRSSSRSLFEQQMGREYTQFLTRREDILSVCDGPREETAEMYEALLPAWTTAAAFRRAAELPSADLPLSLGPLEDFEEVREMIDKAEAQAQAVGPDAAADDVFELVDNVCASLAQLIDAIMQIEESLLSAGQDFAPSPRQPVGRRTVLLILIGLLCAVAVAVVRGPGPQ